MQASAAQAIREEKEEKLVSAVAPLRLPKHLANNARADDAMSAKAVQHTQPATTAAAAPQGRSVAADSQANGDVNKPADVVEVFKQVHFQVRIICVQWLALKWCPSPHFVGYYQFR